ncbi:CHAT domain-containing protein [Thauera sinica]|uniref:CHAT domain-containing protein n=1 Tax=Thauera sinica TaxID=2665146 RepID=A0ABW1ARK4_9RHOO|nr:CHAT domain-containing protein [Thauera sp. K11]ATE59006.1 hypothetical protein CCZ27_02665 [Thauera sp. K11]
MQITPAVIADRTLGLQPTDAVPFETPAFEDGVTLAFLTPADGRGTLLRVIPGTRLQHLLGDQTIEVRLPITVAKLAGAVNACQRAWWRATVEGSSYPYLNLRHRYPFAQASEQPMPSALFNRVVLPKLAEAGAVLFVEIFQPSEQRYPEAHALGTRLREALLHTQDLRVLVLSDECMAPWNFLYLGSLDDPSADGFLGLRHLVEHAFPEVPVPDPRLTVPAVALHANLDLDRQQDTADVAAVAEFSRLLRQFGITPREEHHRAPFLKGLRQRPAESIFYFICHGGRLDAEAGLALDSASLALTPTPEDSDPVVPADITTHLNGFALPGEPLVFINACQSVRSGSLFFSGFAERFLDKRARSLLGSEIEMPAVFARDFADHFFRELFRGGKENAVGRVLLRLRRYYFELQNPLGLAYSLYGGGNAYLPVGLMPAEPPSGGFQYAAGGLADRRPHAAGAPVQRPLPAHTRRTHPRPQRHQVGGVPRRRTTRPS